MVFLQSEFLNVPSNLLHQQRQSCTGCICRIFPQSEFSNVSLNCFVDLMQSHIGCICTIFPQNEISYDSSNCLPSQMQSHRCCIRMTNPLFGWPFWCPISKGKKSELKVKVLCLWIPLFKSEIIQLSLSWIINVNVDKSFFLSCKTENFTFPTQTTLYMYNIYWKKSYHPLRASSLRAGWWPSMEIRSNSDHVRIYLRLSPAPPFMHGRFQKCPTLVKTVTFGQNIGRQSWNPAF